MTKFKQNKKKAGDQGKKQEESRTSARESKCILQYKTAQLSSNTISAKFKNSEDDEVKESISVYKDSDPKDQFIELQKRIFTTFANRYDYFKDGKAKMLSQTYGRCLIGSCETEWNKLVEPIRDWDTTQIKPKIKKLLQKHAMKVLGRKAFDNQQDAMEAGMVKPKSMSLSASIERLYTINEDMKMMTENGESYSDAVMAKKIIYKALIGSARVEYVKKGGRNKTDKEDILEIMEDIEEALEVEREVEAEARQYSRNNHENDRERTGNEDNKQPDNSGKAGEETVPGNGWTDPSKNMCKKPGHKHPWNACPENRFSKNYKGDDAKGREKSGENNSINQKDESQTVVRFEDPGDFDFSDDESVSYQKPEHMMIASPKQEEKHPVTIISLPTAKGEVIVTTCLVDQCFTGMLLMSEKTAKELDLELVETQNGTEYTTAAGTLKTTRKVTVDNIKLPCLSKTRRFQGTFEIIPTGASSKSCYGVFLGSAMMRELGIDTSIINNTISWGEDITTQMVPRNYWTPERMQTEISILKIVDIMKQHPRVSVRLDSHCGTLAPSGISSWFSRARGLRVQNAICDTTNNMGMGTNDNNRHSPIDQSRVNVVAWGKRISTVVARSSDHPFRVDAREGRGWVELYLEVPGSREGDEIMVFPPRQQYYDDVGSSSDSDEDLFVDDVMRIIDDSDGDNNDTDYSEGI
mmetsp:Transcript_43315/g.77844  ORF Transcript_43315/g.77844 Transcript_43315/m.77844 type:complete len:694 (-) Transcript_43315:365-2446(-)